MKVNTSMANVTPAAMSVKSGNVWCRNLCALTGIEVTNIQAHVAVVDAEHVRTIKRSCEAKDLIHQRGRRLSIGTQSDIVLLWRSNPHARPNEQSKQERPQKEEDQQHDFRRIARLPQCRTHNRDD